MDEKRFQEIFSSITGFKQNQFHPLIWIVGEPIIGKNDPSQ